MKGTIYRIRGSNPASSYLQLPRAGTQSLGLTGRYLYLLFRPLPRKHFLVHLDVTTEVRDTGWPLTLPALIEALGMALLGLGAAGCGWSLLLVGHSGLEVVSIWVASPPGPGDMEGTGDRATSLLLCSTSLPKPAG